MTLADVFCPWGWAALAAVLAAAEIVAPGIFLIWLGGAAAATAAIGALIGGDWSVQTVLFAVLALGSVLLGRNVMAKSLPDETQLNRRADRMVGTIVTVVDGIEGGRGRVRIGDSPWVAAGPDLAAGSQVRIVAVEGNIVQVEAA